MSSRKEQLIYVLVGALLGIVIERYVFAPQKHSATVVSSHSNQEFSVVPMSGGEGLSQGRIRDDATAVAVENVYSDLYEAKSKPRDSAASDQNAQTEFLKQLRRLLTDQLWDEAVSLYEEYLRSHEDDGQKIKKLFLDFAQGLRQDKDFDSALQLSQSFLTYDYRDVDFLIEQSADYEGLGFWQKSLETFQLGLTYADAARERKKLQLSLLDFVARMDKVLAENDRTALIDLYESLIDFNLDDAYLNGVYFRLAHLYFQQGQQSRAIESLSMLEPDSEWGAKSQQLLDEYLPPVETASAENKETIALTHYGEHYIVDVMLGGEQSARLLIDTGASMSVLAQRYFQRVASDVDSLRLGTRRFSTAGGRVSAPYYLLFSMELNSQSVKDVGVAIMDIELPPNVDGLLGMNVLKHFSFQIDQDRRELVLQAR